MNIASNVLIRIISVSLEVSFEIHLSNGFRFLLHFAAVRISALRGRMRARTIHIVTFLRWGSSILVGYYFIVVIVIVVIVIFSSELKLIVILC